MVPAAQADADPASDILYTQRIYLPFFGEKVSDANAQTLKKVVDEAWSKGYKVKVALIATRNDLGGVFQLWEKPQTYADFLGRELVFLYKGKLLTAMPNGIGVYQYKKTVDGEKAVVEKIDIGEGADGIANAATVAVAKLAGLKTPPLPNADGGGNSGGGDPGVGARRDRGGWSRDPRGHADARPARLAEAADGVIAAFPYPPTPIGTGRSSTRRLRPGRSRSSAPGRSATASTWSCSRTTA